MAQGGFDQRLEGGWRVLKFLQSSPDCTFSHGTIVTEGSEGKQCLRTYSPLHI